MSVVNVPAPRWDDRGERVIRELLRAGTTHFMGIGGAGMCALAEAVVRQGGRVTGCDTAPGLDLESLRRLGVPVLEGHDPAHLDGADALIVSSAIASDHPEILAASEGGIPVVKRAAALGAWVNAGAVVAVAGTHGKTTTTAMITTILARAGLNPTGFVGGRVRDWAGHLRSGGDDLFVVEADEYDRSFHHLRSTVAVITNLEADHLDIYGDLEGVRSGFRTFLDGVREDGMVLVSADDPGASGLLAGLQRKARTFGFAPGSQLRGLDLEVHASTTRFRVLEDGVGRDRLELRIPGAHNARNALAAAAAARALGVRWDDVRDGLAGFVGVARRFHFLGEGRGIAVVDDYAHHPTELEAAIRTARQTHPDRRIVAVFQPHLYSRSRDFAREFGRVLASADAVWVCEIYPAREPPIPGVDGAFLAREVEAAIVREEGPAREVRVHRELDVLADALAAELRPGDLCLTLGAGTIERVGPELVRRLQAAAGPDGSDESDRPRGEARDA